MILMIIFLRIPSVGSLSKKYHPFSIFSKNSCMMIVEILIDTASGWENFWSNILVWFFLMEKISLLSLAWLDSSKGRKTNVRYFSNWKINSVVKRVRRKSKNSYLNLAILRVNSNRVKRRKERRWSMKNSLIRTTLWWTISKNDF